MVIVAKNIFLKSFFFSILKISITFIIIHSFLSERMKIKKRKKLVANLHYKTVMHIKKIKTSIKPSISIEKSAENH